MLSFNFARIMVDIELNLLLLICIERVILLMLLCVI